MKEPLRELASAAIDQLDDVSTHPAIRRELEDECRWLDRRRVMRVPRKCQRAVLDDNLRATIEDANPRR
jgi:hypothetical protein